MLKCLGGGVPGVDLTQIEVIHDEDGAPLVRLTGEPAARARERGIASWLISLSHTALIAEAMVLARS